ncbi:MAG: hypothetical protein DRP70_16935, partial [Spirochaetes bacterium]
FFITSSPRVIVIFDIKTPSRFSSTHNKDNTVYVYIQLSEKAINIVKLCRNAVSLRDAETLVQHPAPMTHLAKSDISEGLIRLSVGLETDPGWDTFNYWCIPSIAALRSSDSDFTSPRSSPRMVILAAASRTSILS